ncbi:MAG: zinc ribbon domain-containing protein [Clostridia bacterium]|nr:zinc ribbon domain-containing protein [Clostridia bacterium]
MSRYIKEYKYSGSADTLTNFANQFFISNGFVLKEYQGEMVYQKGNGLMVGPKFVKIIAGDNLFHFEAWVKFAILPGVYSGEMDLEGTAGMATKKPLKTIILNFENQLLQMGCTAVATPQQPAYAPPKPQHTPPKPTYTPPAPTQTTYQPPVAPNPPTGYASPNNSQAVNFCPGCGRKLTPDSVFCSTCGRKVK